MSDRSHRPDRSDRSAVRTPRDEASRDARATPPVPRTGQPTTTVFCTSPYASNAAPAASAEVRSDATVAFSPRAPRAGATVIADDLASAVAPTPPPPATARAATPPPAALPDVAFDRVLGICRDVMRRGDLELAKTKLMRLALDCTRTGRSEKGEQVRALVREVEHSLRRRSVATELATPVDLRAARTRAPRLWVEPLAYHPESLFTIRLGDVVLVGRRTLSADFLARASEAMFDGLIDASMLLGVAGPSQVTATEVLQYYHPFAAGEAAAAFAQIAGDPHAVIHVPVARRRSAPPAATLGGADAVELAATAAVLALFADEDLDGRRVYDPSCGEGGILRALKLRSPDVVAVGYDADPATREAAATWLDQVASHEHIVSGTVDVLILRELTATHASPSRAHARFLDLATRVRPGGLIVVYGTAELVVSDAYFALHGFDVRQASSPTEDGSAVFPFFVLRRSATAAT